MVLKLLPLALALASTLAACRLGDPMFAGAAAPPATVVAAFAADHPDAARTRWIREGADYEASFVEGGNAVSVVYSLTGSVREVETAMPLQDLPEPVQAAITRSYPVQAVTETARIVRDGRTTYEAEITENGRARDVIFRGDGTVVTAGS